MQRRLAPLQGEVSFHDFVATRDGFYTLEQGFTSSRVKRERIVVITPVVPTKVVAKKAVPSSENVPNKAAAFSKDVLAIAVGAVCCLVVVAFAVSSYQERPTTPEKLLGIWSTTAPGYESRHLVFVKTGVAFGTGEDSPDGNLIRQIDVTPEGPRTRYRIVYRGEGRGQSMLSFYYDEREHVITFLNQPHLKWTRIKQVS